MLISIIIFTYISGIIICIGSEALVGCSDMSAKRKELTPKAMRMFLLWPILFILWFVKIIILVLNKILYYVLLIFGYNYKKSKIYRFITKNIDL